MNPNLLVALFLLLSGLTGLVTTQIPAWITHVAALAAGAALALSAVKSQSK